MRKYFFQVAERRLRNRYLSGDAYAVVTGCTSGIGKKYAEVLYENGFNLILMARNKDKLAKLKDQLRDANMNSQKIVTLKFEFDKDENYSNENYVKILNLFKTKNIKLLINNVGETTFGGNFYFYDYQKNDSLVNVNIKSVVFLCEAFVNSQKSSQCSKGRRAILNVSSYFGRRPVPGQAVYSASKSFVTNFSRCLYHEIRQDKNFPCDVLCLEPLFVKTNMVRKWQENFFVLNPELVVYSSLMKVNSFRVCTYGNWRHCLQSFLLNLIPGFIFSRFTLCYFNRQFESLRKLLSRRRAK